MTSTTRAKRAGTFALILSAVLGYIPFGLLAPIFPREAELRDASGPAVGVIFAAYACATFIVSPFVGSLLVPRVGRRGSLLLGLVWLGLATIAFAFVTALPAGTAFVAGSIAIRAVQGAGASVIGVTIYSLCAELYGDTEDLTTYMGVVEVAIGLGYMFGPPAGGLAAQLGGFRAPFFLFGTLPLAAVPLVACLLPPGGEAPRRLSADAGETMVALPSGSAGVAILALLRRPLVLVMLATAAVSNTAYSFFEPVLQRHVGDLVPTSAKLGLLFSLVAVCYIVCCPLVGVLARPTYLGSPTVVVLGQHLAPLLL